jgi:hypothetical protein
MRTRLPRNVKPMLVPVPTDIRRWIERKAIANASAMNSVIISALRSAMEAERERRVRIKMDPEQQRARAQATVD